MVTALAEGLNIVLNKVVTQITHSNSGCSVKMEDGSVMTADRVLVAVPLGVLKSNLVTFQPPLSAHKAGAIQRIGFGAINKVCSISVHCDGRGPIHVLPTHCLADYLRGCFLRC